MSSLSEPKKVMYNEILTVTDLADILRCSPASIYSMTRRRGQLRYQNPLPVLRLPCGLRFRRSDIDDWISRIAESGKRVP